MMPEENGEKNRFIFGEDLLIFHLQRVKVLKIQLKEYCLIFINI